jgi:hypothetical protein
MTRQASRSRLGDLHAFGICEYLVDLVLAELPLGMLLDEMLMVGSVPRTGRSSIQKYILFAWP